MSFKRAAASPTGGRELAESSVTCPSNDQQTIHAVLSINGQVGVFPTSFLIDSGATVSVIKQDMVAEEVPIAEHESSIKRMGYLLTSSDKLMFW